MKNKIFTKNFSQIKHEEKLIEKIKKGMKSKSPNRSSAMLWNSHRDTLNKYNYDFNVIVAIFDNCQDMAEL